MLSGLAIRDIVLIDRLELDFAPGLNVLTGETGAGKSILLDALGLATGARAGQGLVRKGAQAGAVTARFEIAADHPARARLTELDIADEGDILLRRAVQADGRSRAYVNDVAVGVAALRELGDLLIEAHGQHDGRGLLDAARHRALLDQFGGHERLLAATRKAHAAAAEAAQVAKTARAEAEAAARERDWLAHAAHELETLAAEPGEEARLAGERALMMAAEKIADDLAAGLAALDGPDGAEARVASAARRIGRAAERAEGRLDQSLAALDRAAVELAEARGALEAAAADLEFNPARLEKMEERLFALRAAARKYDCPPDALAEVAANIAARLALAEAGAGAAAEREAEAAAARAAYLDRAQSLTVARVKAAKRLDKRVADELKPLKLDRARFSTLIEGDGREGPAGLDRVAFEVATNRGADLGPLTRIASGGELSRFMLALKVAIAERGSAATLIFDEIDQGVGGAVADAIGSRLARLAETAQLILVTHSPQIAARGAAHFRIEKQESRARAQTRVARLDPEERREEIARMLAGAAVTEAARAAADSLIAGAS